MMHMYWLNVKFDKNVLSTQFIQNRKKTNKVNSTLLHSCKLEEYKAGNFAPFANFTQI